MTDKKNYIQAHNLQNEYLSYRKDKLAEYSSQFDNTFVHGGYREQEKYKIIDTFDMMCYNYQYNFVNDAAIANKYYDSLIMKKPMFVNPKTRLGDFIVRNGMGVGIDENDMNAADKIFDWYINIGGIQKSLANLLSELSDNEYEIDLMLFCKTGGLLADISENINIIEGNFFTKALGLTHAEAKQCGFAEFINR